MLEKIQEILLGDRDAIAYFMALRSVLHFWDDLIDKDQAISDEDVNGAMWNALIAVPSNPFYLRHAETLSAMTANAIANWQAANQFEAEGKERQLQLAFVIRSDYANLLIHCAYLLGGREWMLRVTPMIRDLWTQEDFLAYQDNLRIERNRRNSRALKKEIS